MTHSCPTCGQPVSGVVPMKALPDLRIGGHVMQSVIRALVERKGGPMSTEELVWAVYRGREPGKPAGSIKSVIRHHRAALRAHGWELRGRAFYGYRLQAVGRAA